MTPIPVAVVVPDGLAVTRRRLDARDVSSLHCATGANGSAYPRFLGPCWKIFANRYCVDQAALPAGPGWPVYDSLARYCPNLR